MRGFVAVTVATCIAVLTTLARGQDRPPGALRCWGWHSGQARGIRCRMRDGRTQDYLYEPRSGTFVRFFEYDGAFRR